MTRLRPEKIEELYDVPSDQVQEFYDKLDSKAVQFIAFSGKIASGKDSVAPLVLEILDFSDSEHLFFSEPLKKEITQVINILKGSWTKKSAAEKIITAMNIDFEDAKIIVDFIYDEASKGLITTGYDRTVNNRRALQHWGTEIRREQDDLYWVKPVCKKIIELSQVNKSVYITDTRFPNEALSVLDLGGSIIRLDVSPEEQAERLKNRDGIELSESAMNHPSETSLDDFDKFTVRLNTSDFDNAIEVSREVAMQLKMFK